MKIERTSRGFDYIFTVTGDCAQEINDHLSKVMNTTPPAYFPQIIHLAKLEGKQYVGKFSKAQKC